MTPIDIQEVVFQDPSKAPQFYFGEARYAITKFHFIPEEPMIMNPSDAAHPGSPAEVEILEAYIFYERSQKWKPVYDDVIDLFNESEKLYSKALEAILERRHEDGL